MKKLKTEKLKPATEMLVQLVDLAEEKVECCGCGNVIRVVNGKINGDILNVEFGQLKTEEPEVQQTFQLPLCGLCMERMARKLGVLLVCLHCGESLLLDRRYARLIYERKDGKQIHGILTDGCPKCSRSADGELKPTSYVKFF